MNTPNTYPFVNPDMHEKNPGSTADFVGSPAVQSHFAELSARFVAAHPYVEVQRTIGAPATAEVIEGTNS